MLNPTLQRVLLLGCGYTGLEVARQACGAGLTVLATTRSAAHTEAIEQSGAIALVYPTLQMEALAAHLDASTALIVTFPPDGESDARLSQLAQRAYASVYVSSTGVYGDTHGRIDDTTPVAPDSPRTAARLAAESAWQGAGATVLRAAAIYGPGRGQHERVRSGSARIAGDGRHHICRIHVEDLARAILHSARLKLGPHAYVIADDLPAAQGDVIHYLAALLRVPLPAGVPLESAPETLRHDRQVDATRFKRDSGLTWRYPTYREGFEACLRAEAAKSQA